MNPLKPLLRWWYKRRWGFHLDKGLEYVDLRRAAKQDKRDDLMFAYTNLMNFHKEKQDHYRDKIAALNE